MDSQEQPCDVVALPGISVNLVAVPSVGSCVPFTVCSHTNKSNHSWRRCALSLFLLSLLCLGLEVSGWWPTWPGGDGKGAAAPPSRCLGVLPAVTQVTGGAPLRLEHSTAAAERLGICNERNQHWCSYIFMACCTDAAFPHTDKPLSRRHCIAYTSIKGAHRSCLFLALVLARWSFQK